MRKEVIDQYSYTLDRNMKVRIYGHYGDTFLFFPSQDHQSDDYENFGVISSLSDFIEQGKIKIICIDGIDYESFSSNASYEHRAYMQEQYYHYVINEVLPLIYSDNHGFCLPFVSGCSMGATQAAIFFFRRPDLFKGVLALSGIYDVSYFFSSWCNLDIYNNSPTRFLKNMPWNHTYISLYNKRDIIFCVGQGDYEHLVDWSFYELRNVLFEKGINAWMDVWGQDSAHHWYWWIKQYRYFIPHLINK